MFAVAFLYSCVGHAGASGYIAAMTLFGLAPAVIKPTALALNILVALIASWQFRRAGHFSWRLFWPLALASVPCAFLGGRLDLPTHAFKVAVGLVLLFSAARFLFDPLVLLKGFAWGLGVSLLAAAWPAWQAGQSRPITLQQHGDDAAE